MENTADLKDLDYVYEIKDIEIWNDFYNHETMEYNQITYMLRVRRVGGRNNKKIFIKVKKFGKWKTQGLKKINQYIIDTGVTNQITLENHKELIGQFIIEPSLSGTKHRSF